MTACPGFNQQRQKISLFEDPIYGATKDCAVAEIQLMLSNRLALPFGNNVSVHLVDSLQEGCTVVGRIKSEQQYQS